MNVDVWSDIVCPWCYVGKRRLETAVSQFPHAAALEVRWRSFELDPSAPARGDGSHAARLAAKYGTTVEEAEDRDAYMTAVAAGEGLEFQMDELPHSNTFDAHRLLHLAADVGLQDVLKERLLRAYFTDGASIGDHRVLRRIVVHAGLDARLVDDVLGSERYAQEVRADEQQAKAYGIGGVPFFVVDERYGVSGAQPAETILAVLNRAWEEANLVRDLVTAGHPGASACAEEGCAILGSFD